MRKQLSFVLPLFLFLLSATCDLIAAPTSNRPVLLSKCRKIVIRGSHPKVAFASGSSLHFKYRTTGAIRHELFHAYDPFNFAYRYWKSLNHEDFYYIYGGRKGIAGDLSNREILNPYWRNTPLISSFLLIFP